MEFTRGNGLSMKKIFIGLVVVFFLIWLIA